MFERLRATARRLASWLPRLLVFVASSCIFLAVSRDAHAFASTIRNGYTNCTPCHVDPSGSGPLTGYGRAMASEVIDMQLFEDEAGGDAPPSSGFLWGAVKLPEALILQAEFRLLHLRQKVETVPLFTRNILMQADGLAAVQLGDFTASVSLGYAGEGALGASLSGGDKKNLVSRHHWLGYSLFDASLMLRAGRYNLPYGLRSIEHTLWAREQTHTNINDQQQYGFGAVYQHERFRSELMLILGNLQLRPDDFRERGYSAYIEGFLSPTFTLGASSQITHRALDPASFKETYRHAHGLFSRYQTPWQPLLLLAEANYVLESPAHARHRDGLVAYLQADAELARGIHLIATGELQNVGETKQPYSYGAWLSYAWFFAPHTDLRLDGIYQTIALGPDLGRLSAVTFLLQGHLYL